MYYIEIGKQSYDDIVTEVKKFDTLEEAKQELVNCIVDENNKYYMLRIEK